MRWRTYNRHVERYDAYEDILDRGTFALAAKLSPSAECRLPESVHFAESDVILGVVRARSVHKVGNGHNCDWAAA